MPRAEDNEERNASTEELLAGNRDFLEYGQRHGLLEDERRVSGCKRICFCYGRICGIIHRYIVFIMLICYMIIYLIGYYSGYVSNCLCEMGSNVSTD